MSELHNTEREIYSFRLRLVVAVIIVLICFGILLLRFFILQVIRYQDFHAQAEENRISVVPIPPNRGLIFDRNGVVLARNYSAYTLEITPTKVSNLDATIDALATIVEIQPRDRRRFKKLLEETKSLESLPIRTRLADEEMARFAAHRFRFPGVEIKARLFRQYPLGKTASHVIGYIGRISQRDQDAIDESEDAENYRGTEYIGKIGLEESYEHTLHGVTGFERVEVSAAGRPVRTLSRTAAISGNNLILSLDIHLQQIAEQAFGERRGALVAIEPQTGEILAFVSMPTFDPNLFVEGIDVDNWKILNESPDKPLLNRPLRGTYPPGSTYKPFLALAALVSGKRHYNSAIYDPGYFVLGNHKFRDSKPEGNGVVDLFKSIVVSSDTYYYMLANDMGVDTIYHYMKPWGFGQLTKIDLKNEVSGILPSTTWKLDRYKQKWIPGETISIGIGQGYNAFTPLQMAQATAALADNGTLHTPHLVKEIEDNRTNRRHLLVNSEPGTPLAIKQEYIDFVKRAMLGVNETGTGAPVFKDAPYKVAGKTGTAQVVGIKQNEKYDARKVAERHRDHSWYIAFAPADQPTIALAIIVENGGFGSQAAAPIARQLLDYYLLGKTPEFAAPSDESNAVD